MRGLCQSLKAEREMVRRKKRASERKDWGEGRRETPIYLKKSSLSQKEVIKTDKMGTSSVLDSHQFILLYLKARLKKLSFVLFLNRLGT